MKKKLPQQFNPGLIPSPIDTRDLLSSQFIPEIKRYPREYPEPFDLPILDQDNLLTRD